MPNLINTFKPNLINTFKPDIILIDGMNLSKRYHHALNIADKNGVPMGAVHGVLKYIHQLQSQYPDTKIIFLWEGKTSYRKTLYPEYKATRCKSSNDIFYISLKILMNALRYIKVKQVYYPGMEADDLAGFYCKIHKDKLILLISNDCDWFQYVNSRTYLQMKTTIYDLTKSINKLGFAPRKIPIFKTLTGDSSDNIKGINRFPKKLAIHLCDSIEALKHLKDFQFYNTDILSEKVLKKWYKVICESWEHIEFIYNLIKFNPSLINPIKIRRLKRINSIQAFNKLLLKHDLKFLLNLYKK